MANYKDRVVYEPTETQQPVNDPESTHKITVVLLQLQGHGHPFSKKKKPTNHYHINTALSFPEKKE